MKKLLFFLLTFSLTFSVSYAENYNTICNGKVKINFDTSEYEGFLYYYTLGYDDIFVNEKHEITSSLKQEDYDYYKNIIDFVKNLENRDILSCKNLENFTISNIDFSNNNKNYIMSYYTKNNEGKHNYIFKDDELIKEYLYENKTVNKISRYGEDYLFEILDTSPMIDNWDFCKTNQEGFYLNNKRIACERSDLYSIYGGDNTLDEGILKYTDLTRYFSKKLKGQDTFGIYTIPETVKNNIKNTLETRKQSILRNKRSLYKALEKYFDEYENKNNKKNTKEQYVKYELYNYLYGKIKILELTQ